MKINGHEVSAGCIIDGHWGQYGPDRLAEIAYGLGWRADCTSADPRLCRNIADMFAELGDTDREVEWWQCHYDSFERVESWLNDHAEGCRIEWVDGECFIVDLICPNCGHDSHDDERCEGTADDGENDCVCSWPDTDNFTS